MSCSTVAHTSTAVRALLCSVTFDDSAQLGPSPSECVWIGLVRPLCDPVVNPWDRSTTAQRWRMSSLSLALVPLKATYNGHRNLDLNCSNTHHNSPCPSAPSSWIHLHSLSALRTYGEYLRLGLSAAGQIVKRTRISYKISKYIHLLALDVLINYNNDLYFQCAWFHDLH